MPAVLSMRSLPAPPSIPVADAVVVEAVAARETPLPVMAASTATVVASAVARMVPPMSRASSPSPAPIPMAAAELSVPPSQTASVEPDRPIPVMLAATATPVEEASAVMMPSLWMVSLPPPPSMPTAWAAVVAVLVARDTPVPVMATSAATVVAKEVAVISPMLMTVSSSIPAPASMPLATAVVCVPPSQTASAAPERPVPVMLAATATPVAEASAVMAPSLWITSLPVPASMPVAWAVVVAVLVARDRPVPVMATSAATVTASEVAVMLPMLKNAVVPVAGKDAGGSGSGVRAPVPDRVRRAREARAGDAGRHGHACRGGVGCDVAFALDGVVARPGIDAHSLGRGRGRAGGQGQTGPRNSRVYADGDRSGVGSDIADTGDAVVPVSGVDAGGQGGGVRPAVPDRIGSPGNSGAVDRCRYGDPGGRRIGQDRPFALNRVVACSGLDAHRLRRGRRGRGGE